MAKKTPNQIAFEKEARRIRRAITRLEKRGFEFTEKPSLQKPSRVTKKQLARLKAIKPETLYEKTTYTTQTGEQIPGTTRRAQERKAASIKAAQTRKMRAIKPDEFFDEPPRIGDVIINNAVEQLGQTMPREMFDTTVTELRDWSFDKIWKLEACDKKQIDKNILESMFNNHIMQYGIDEIAQRIESKAEVWFNAISIALYWYRSEEPVNQAFGVIASILKGGALTASESKKFTDMSEFLVVGG